MKLEAGGQIAANCKLDVGTKKKVLTCKNSYQTMAW